MVFYDSSLPQQRVRSRLLLVVNRLYGVHVVFRQMIILDGSFLQITCCCVVEPTVPLHFGIATQQRAVMCSRIGINNFTQSCIVILHDHPLGLWPCLIRSSSGSLRSHSCKLGNTLNPCLSAESFCHGLDRFLPPEVLPHIVWSREYMSAYAGFEAVFLC